MTQNHPDRPGSADDRTDDRTDEPGDVLDAEGQTASVDPASAYAFEDLAGAANCIQIRFGLNLYTLRKTRTGRLVLNK
jgi:hemin uptake protein HemP